MTVLGRYKYSILLVVSLVALFTFYDSPPVERVIVWIENLGYLGALFAGAFFTISFTVAPAGLVLYNLAEVWNPFLVALVGGLGALLGDLLILRFFKDSLFVELAPLARKLGGDKLFCLCNTPLCGWLMAILGGAIIASPLPDELGVALLGIMEVGGIKFLAISLVFNTLGILALALIATV